MFNPSILPQEELAIGQHRLRHHVERNRMMKLLKARNDKEIFEQAIAQAAELRLIEACENVARQKAEKFSGGAKVNFISQRHSD